MATATSAFASTSDSGQTIIRLGQELASSISRKSRHKQADSASSLNHEQISYNKLVQLEMRARQRRPRRRQSDSPDDSKPTISVSSSTPEMELKAVLSHNEPAVSPLRETASEADLEKMDTIYDRPLNGQSNTRNSSDDNLAQASDSSPRPSCSPRGQRDRHQRPHVIKPIIRGASSASSASGAEVKQIANSHDRHCWAPSKMLNNHHYHNYYYHYYCNNLSSRVTNLRALVLVMTLACILWSLSSVPARCRAYQLTNNLIANNLPPKFVQSTGSQSAMSASSTGQGGTSSEIVVRVKEGPQSIGRLIYTLRGEDPDDDPLTFGVLGTMASDLLRIENVPGNQANVYLRKELDRETTESHQVVITLTDGKLGKGNWVSALSRPARGHYCAKARLAARRSTHKPKRLKQSANGAECCATN